MARIGRWQSVGFYDYGPYWLLIALAVAGALIGVVMFGSLAGSMLPFVLRRLGFDPASASAPFVATLVDVTGLWSDSVVLYDRHADRWVVSRPGGLPAGADLCLAVSRTSDPTGSYAQYAFAVNTTTNGLASYFNDYPKISTFGDAYYATADPNKIFSGVGNTISAFERAAMLAGNPTPTFVTFFVPAPQHPSQPSHSHMLAADLDGARLPRGARPSTSCRSRIRDRRRAFFLTRRRAAVPLRRPLVGVARS